LQASTKLFQSERPNVKRLIFILTLAMTQSPVLGSGALFTSKAQPPTITKTDKYPALHRVDTKTEQKIAQNPRDLKSSKLIKDNIKSLKGKVKAIEIEYGDLLHGLMPFVLTGKKLSDSDMRKTFGNTEGFQQSYVIPQYLVSYSDLEKIYIRFVKAFSARNEKGVDRFKSVDANATPANEIGLEKHEKQERFDSYMKENGLHIFRFYISADGRTLSMGVLNSSESKPVFEYIYKLSSSKYEKLHMRVRDISKVYLSPQD
jgi:hypothetical protein